MKARQVLIADGIAPPPDWDTWSGEEQNSWIYTRLVRETERNRLYGIVLSSWDNECKRLMYQLSRLREKLDV